MHCLCLNSARPKSLLMCGITIGPWRGQCNIVRVFRQAFLCLFFNAIFADSKKVCMCLDLWTLKAISASVLQQRGTKPMLRTFYFYTNLFHFLFFTEWAMLAIIVGNPGSKANRLMSVFLHNRPGLWINRKSSPSVNRQWKGKTEETGESNLIKQPKYIHSFL